MKLIHGDCLVELKIIESDSVDLVLTDIPYNEVNRPSNGLRNLDKGLADSSLFDLDLLLSELNRVCNGSIYIFCGIGQMSKIRNSFLSLGLSTRLCVWEKTNPSPMNGQNIWLSSIECCVFAKKKGATFNRHCKSSVWRFPTARGKLHPTMKPINLMEYILESSSLSGDLVLDPFMGSGSTGIACLNTGRHFIGIEKDDHYFRVASDRISKVVTGL